MIPSLGFLFLFNAHGARCTFGPRLAAPKSVGGLNLETLSTLVLGLV